MVSIISKHIVRLAVEYAYYAWYMNKVWQDVQGKYCYIKKI